MSKYLLDTCILSEMNKKEPNQGLIDWFKVNRLQDMYISILTVGELQKGINKLEHSIKKNRLQDWLDNYILPQFTNKIIDIDVNVITQWSKLVADKESVGESMPAIDSLIVASAIEYGLSIITRNTKDMQNAVIPIINPYE